MAEVTYNQPTSQPTAKVAAVGKAGLIATGVAAVVTLLAFAGVIVPEDISSNAVAAITGAITLYSLVQSIWTFAAGYLTKSKKTTPTV